jgi:hypothetical protein
MHYKRDRHSIKYRWCIRQKTDTDRHSIGITDIGTDCAFITGIGTDWHLSQHCITSISIAGIGIATDQPQASRISITGITQTQHASPDRQLRQTVMTVSPDIVSQHCITALHRHCDRHRQTQHCITSTSITDKYHRQTQYRHRLRRRLSAFLKYHQTDTDSTTDSITDSITDRQYSEQTQDSITETQTQTVFRQTQTETQTASDRQYHQH